MLFWIRVKIAWKRFLLSWRFLFAHHPLCDKYRDQVFLVFGVYLCQGCTLLYSGLFIGLVFLMFIETASLVFFDWFIIATLLVFPSFFALIPQLHINKRRARFLNGVGFSVIFWGSTSLNLLIEKLLLIFYMMALFLFFILLRTRFSNQGSLCLSCEEKNSPVCSGYRKQAQVEEKIDDYTRKLLYDD